MRTWGLIVALTFIPAAGATDWHAAPDGKPDGDGSPARPLDLTTALAATARVKPGDTVWLKGGVYKHPDRRPGSNGYPVKLAGAPDKPVVVRALPGQRATLDGGLQVMPPATYLWVRDLEILVSEPHRDSQLKGGKATDLPRPAGGLEIRTGTGCKYINLVIHDNLGGVGFWADAKDSELYGCLIYDNGWQDLSRHHGHAIYTQNRDGVKVISNCILSARRGRTGGSYTMHAYTERGSIQNFLLEDNVAYEEGPFLVGGLTPVRNARVLRNHLYGVPLLMGYGKRPNEDCELRDNVVVNGELRVSNFVRVVNERNLVLPQGTPRPARTKVVLLPNRHDPARAHLVVYNWQRQPQVRVPVAGFLKPGEAFRLLDPKDFYGKPVVAGTCDNEGITVPVAGEFGVFVVMKGEPSR
jgi:hypothetical protein